MFVPEIGGVEGDEWEFKFSSKLNEIDSKISELEDKLQEQENNVKKLARTLASE